jgi:hypothetical protein
MSAGGDWDSALSEKLASERFFSSKEIEMIHQRVGSIEIYKRTSLPDRCFQCGSADFNYVSMTCQCGVNLYHETDSMTAAITVANGSRDAI